MIDKAILDEVLPVPELEALKEEKISELKEEGFVITNFHSGGVFYTLLMVVLRIKIEFTELLRVILNNMFLSTPPARGSTSKRLTMARNGRRPRRRKDLSH